MEPRFGEGDTEFFGALASRLRAAAHELRLSGAAGRDNSAAKRLETYARAIEDDLHLCSHPSLGMASTTVRKMAGS